MLNTVCSDLIAISYEHHCNWRLHPYTAAYCDSHLDNHQNHQKCTILTITIHVGDLELEQHLALSCNRVKEKC